MDEDIVVIIPGLAIAVIDLHHADAAFDEAAGHEAAAAKIVIAIAGADGFGFFGDIEDFGRFGLHAESDFGGLDIGFEDGVCAFAFHVETVEFGQKVKLAALFGRVDFGIADVVNKFVGSLFAVGNVSALIDGRQESGGPKLGADDGVTGAENDEAWEVLIFGPEPVSEPGAHGGTARDTRAAVHHEQRRFVIRDVGIHGANHAAIVNALTQFGENLADFDAALAAAMKLERRAEEAAGFAFGFEVAGGHGLAAVLLEQRFGVEGIHLRRAAV